MKRIPGNGLLCPQELAQHAAEDHLKIGASLRFKNYATGLMFVAIGFSAIMIAW
jgi:hypothetical protein